MSALASRPRVRPLRILGGVVGAIALGFVALGVLLTQPFVLTRRPSQPGRRAVEARLRADVASLVREFPRRSESEPEVLHRAAGFVEQAFRSAGCVPERQTFVASGHSYDNVLVRLGPRGGPRVVVGAHYDAAHGLPGADDNASGVAVLLEISRLLHGLPLHRTVELVAFATEEPPYFGTEHMGSAVHAHALRAARTEVHAMVSLEMLGFYTDAPGSQRFPHPLMSAFYPTTGNFVAVVGRPDDAALVRRVTAAVRGASPLPVRSVAAPLVFSGVDFSDQRNYWALGYPAVMVTDTAFYRNERYHTALDTPDTLDYPRTTQAAQGVFEAVLALAND